MGIVVALCRSMLKYLRGPQTSSYAPHEPVQQKPLQRQVSSWCSCNLLISLLLILLIVEYAWLTINSTFDLLQPPRQREQGCRSEKPLESSTNDKSKETHPDVVSIVLWRSTTFASILWRNIFALLPVFTTTCDLSGGIRVSFFNLLSPALHLQSLGLRAPSTSARVIVISVFVSYLSLSHVLALGYTNVFPTYLTTASATTKLPPLLVTKIQITTNNALVQLGSANVSQTGQRLRTSVEFNKAETTRCPVHLVKLSSEYENQ